jgi:hypothetical protein
VFAQVKSITFMEPITGKNIRIIQAALPEAQSRKIDLDLYKITVIPNTKPNNSITVLFFDVNAKSPFNGVRNPGKVPVLEVKLNKDTLKVLNANVVSF